MFWDAVSGVYDVFAYGFNRRTHLQLRKKILEYIHGNDEVLELGCGTGLLSEIIAPSCKNLTATDLSGKMLEKTRKKCRRFSNITYEPADIRNLKYKDESFDVIVAANVIHLIEDPVTALQEMKRICRKGGRLIVPTYMNRTKEGSDSTFVKTVGKAGADFKKQFTYETYQQFWKEPEYT